MPETRRKPRDETRQQCERPHVAIDARFYPDTAHLDDDLSPIFEASAVDLSNRSGSDGLAVETVEKLVEGRPEPTLDFAYCNFGGERRDILLERLQSGNVVVRQQVSAHAHGLPEFNEGRPKTRKNKAEPLRGP